MTWRMRRFQGLEVVAIGDSLEIGFVSSSSSSSDDVEVKVVSPRKETKTVAKAAIGVPKLVPLPPRLDATAACSAEIKFKFR